MTDIDPARVTRQPAGSFRGNSGAILEFGKAGLASFAECGGFDVEHDLITLGTRAADMGLVSNPSPHPKPSR